MSTDDPKKLTPQQEMTQKAKRLADALVQAAKDPDSPEYLAQQEADDLHEQRVIAAYHASRKRPDEPPGQPLADVAALRAYLDGKGLTVRPRANGLHVADPPIDIDWMQEHQQVRFFAHPGIAVRAERKAGVAEVVARANSQFQVWRTEPELTAEYIAPLADGALLSREVDRAVRILKTTLARDMDELRRAAGG